MNFSLSNLTAETNFPYIIRSVIFTMICLSVIFLIDFSFDMTENDFKNIIWFLITVNWVLNVTIRKIFLVHPHLKETNGVILEDKKEDKDVREK